MDYRYRLNWRGPGVALAAVAASNILWLTGHTTAGYCVSLLVVLYLLIAAYALAVTK